MALTGAWGALSVFVGPLFNWNPTSTTSWHWTMQNWMLHLIPGAVGFGAGLLILMASPRRLVGGRKVIDLAALAAAAAGAWFVIGPALWRTFENGQAYLGANATNSFWNQLGSSLGPGLLLTFLGGMALKAGIARAGMAVMEPAGHHQQRGLTEKESEGLAKASGNPVPARSSKSRWRRSRRQSGASTLGL